MIDVAATANPKVCCLETPLPYTRRASEPLCTPSVPSPPVHRLPSPRRACSALCSSSQSPLEKNAQHSCQCLCQQRSPQVLLQLPAHLRAQVECCVLSRGPEVLAKPWTSLSHRVTRAAELVTRTAQSLWSNLRYLIFKVCWEESSTFEEPQFLYLENGRVLRTAFIPPKFYVEALTSNLTVFGDRAYKEVINKGYMSSYGWGLAPIKLGCL